VNSLAVFAESNNHAPAAFLDSAPSRLMPKRWGVGRSWTGWSPIVAAAQSPMISRACLALPINLMVSFQGQTMIHKILQYFSL